MKLFVLLVPIIVTSFTFVAPNTALVGTLTLTRALVHETQLVHFFVPNST